MESNENQMESNEEAFEAGEVSTLDRRWPRSKRRFSDRIRSSR